MPVHGNWGSSPTLFEERGYGDSGNVSKVAFQPIWGEVCCKIEHSGKSAPGGTLGITGTRVTGKSARFAGTGGRGLKIFPLVQFLKQFFRFGPEVPGNADQQ